MRISILYNFRDTVWGGANQFLKALRNAFIEMGCYEDFPHKADILIFISYPFGNEKAYNIVKKLKSNQNCIVVNRMNGPISLYRDTDLEVDNINFHFNHYVADGTIFQSEWSRQQCYNLGLKQNKYETVIINSVNKNIFYKSHQTSRSESHKKIKLIAVSWSDNIKKGFDIYSYLDTHLDFKKYSMTFVGNSPVEFKNITHISPLPSDKLADKFREHDILIYASQIETCSNTLLEALHCGLPAVARNNSSQPQIVSNAGILFEDTSDILSSIDTLAWNLEHYITNIQLHSIDQISREYYDFCSSIYSDLKSSKYQAKKWGTLTYADINCRIIHWKCLSRIKSMLKKCFGENQ